MMECIVGAELKTLEQSLADEIEFEFALDKDNARWQVVSERTDYRRLPAVTERSAPLSPASFWTLRARFVS